MPPNYFVTSFTCHDFFLIKFCRFDSILNWRSRQELALYWFLNFVSAVVYCWGCQSTQPIFEFWTKEIQDGPDSRNVCKKCQVKKKNNSAILLSPGRSLTSYWSTHYSGFYKFRDLYDECLGPVLTSPMRKRLLEIEFNRAIVKCAVQPFNEEAANALFNVIDVIISEIVVVFLYAAGKLCDSLALDFRSNEKIAFREKLLFRVRLCRNFGCW